MTSSSEDDLAQRLRALRPSGHPASPPAAEASSRSAGRDDDEIAKRLEALGPSKRDPQEVQVSDQEVERYLRAMSPPDATPLDLPSLPSSSSKPSKLTSSLDATDAAVRTFVGPITEITFIPAPADTSGGSKAAARDPEEEEALIRRLQDQLMVEGKDLEWEKKERVQVEKRLRMLRGDGAEPAHDLGAPPSGDLSEFGLDVEGAGSSEDER